MKKMTFAFSLLSLLNILVGITGETSDVFPRMFLATQGIILSFTPLCYACYVAGKR